MKSRKTIDVDDIKKMVNFYLASESPNITDDMRLGHAILLSNILLKTGNYMGFGYIGCSQDENGNSIIPNESKRFYY